MPPPLALAFAVLLAGTDQAALHAAAAATCAGFPLRSTGTIHYVCDCAAGAQARCSAGSDSADGLTPGTARQSVAAIVAAWNAMGAGDTIALCRGGAWTTSAALDLAATRPCSAAADMRAAANTTTCDLRDYAPGWGGTAKPILRAAADLRFGLLQFWSSDTHGIRVLNLDLEGGGHDTSALLLGSSGGGNQHDTLVCGNTFNAFGGLGVQLNVSTQRVDVWGNRFTDFPRQVILGAGRGFTVDANHFSDAGRTAHVLYLSAQEPGAADGMSVVNNEIRYPGGGCANTTTVTAHGAIDGLTIENNLVDDGGSACPGIWIDAGGYPTSYFRHLVIRRNWVRSGHYTPIGVAQAPGALIENNVVVQTHAGNAGIVVPSEAHDAGGTRGDTTTAAVVRNNTLWFAGRSAGAIVSQLEGTGYVIANNAVLLPGGGGPCFATALPPAAYAFVGNNACSGGVWGTAYDTTLHLTSDPAFASPPDDLSLQPASPLRGAGSAAHAPAVDFQGAARPSPPSIGAYDVGGGGGAGGGDAGGGGGGCGTSGGAPGALAGLLLLAVALRRSGGTRTSTTSWFASWAPCSPGLRRRLHGRVPAARWRPGTRAPRHDRRRVRRLRHIPGRRARAAAQGVKVSEPTSSATS